MNPVIHCLAVTCLLVFFVSQAPAQSLRPGFNYDEDKVPPYTLPDPLVMSNGERITNADNWRVKRRPELVKLFEENMYGRAPGRPPAMTFKSFDLEREALGGKAIRKQVSIFFTGKEDGPSMDLLIYLPAHAQGPVPVFVVPNFQGNHAVNADPSIKLSNRWIASGPKNLGVVKNHATEKSRGSEHSRFPIDAILSRGYGLATYYYGDLSPDYDNNFTEGVLPAFDHFEGKRPGDAWAAIAAWAWGASRALDYLETDKDVDAKRAIMLGHSRLGKTSLWAGAKDERFALVISNDSGCSGAALSKRVFGETVERINEAFPHWFCGNYKKYDNHVDDMPFDQHELIALIAPRPVYVASAEEDKWADPKGEFLSALNANPVYKLFGLIGMPASEMPPVDHPILDGSIGYHIRTGEHDLKEYDWQQYMNFADRHLKKQ